MNGTPHLDVLAIVRHVAGSIRPNLDLRHYLRASGRVTRDKGDGHLAHRIDRDAEEMLFKQLEGAEYSGLLFSEEAGLVHFGPDQDLVVVDPYCNTTITFNGIRESAVTLYWFNNANDLVSAAIADLQIRRFFSISADSAPYIYWELTDEDEPARCSTVDELREATVVISLLKRSRRRYLRTAVAERAGTLLSVDGGIVALRMCAGDVDAFVDHEYGQPSYEALAYLAVERCGGTVTDGAGRPINWSGLLNELRLGEVRRQTIIAAGTARLHREILAALTDNQPAQEET
jgi:fructose-1,6-bisphosphatase/inositol monophosphatase family enzyme